MVEVQGGSSGFLATMGGLAAGASRCYIPEEGMNIHDLGRDLEHLITTSSEKPMGRIILKSENASEIYSTKFISDLFDSESQGAFDCRHVILGHLQQGGLPSALDRIRGARLAMYCIDFLEEQATKCSPSKPANLKVYTTDATSAAVIGLKGTQVTFSPVVDLVAETDQTHRRPFQQWWIRARSLMKILAGLNPT